MKTKIIISTLSVITIIMVFVFYKTQNNFIIHNNTDTNSFSDIIWESKVIEKKDEQNYINISYPYFKSADTEALNQYLNVTIISLLKDTEEKLYEKVKTDPILYEGSKIDLNITYKVTGVENGIVSIEFIVTDFSGGGNGSHDFPLVINWDLKSNRLLKNNELFCSENYISKLIPIVRKQIIQNFSNSDGILQPLPKEVIDWVYRGTENEPDNWNNFLLSKDGLIVVFPPYQVISGGGGVVSALIPKANIPNLLCLP